MLEPFLFLLLVLSTLYIWNGALRARERAVALSRSLCTQANVQLLDQSVALKRFGLRRVPGSGLRVWRCYGFDVSTDGSDRARGSIDLFDDQIIAFDLPDIEGPSGRPAASRTGNVIELHPQRRTDG